MERAATTRLDLAEQVRRQRHVDALGRQPMLELGALELFLARRNGGFDRFTRGIERHPTLAVAHVTECELQRRLPSQVRNPRFVELAERVRGGDCGERLVS